MVSKLSERDREMSERLVSGALLHLPEDFWPAIIEAYSEPLGILHFFGAPGPLISSDTSATVSLGQYSFRIDDTERAVIETCVEYFGSSRANGRGLQKRLAGHDEPALAYATFRQAAQPFAEATCRESDLRGFVFVCGISVSSSGATEQVLGGISFGLIGCAVTFSHHSAEYFGVIQLPPYCANALRCQR